MSKKKKAMLSQPMAGKTDEEIVATREAAIKVLEVSTDGRIEELEFELKLLKGENRSGN